MKKIFVCGISALLLSLQAWAQTEYIHAGKITFERRTNLEKRFTDDRMKRFVTEENKIRIESFQLFFNDTASYFAVVPSNEPEEMASPSLKKPASPEQKKITSSDNRDKCVIHKLAAAESSTT